MQRGLQQRELHYLEVGDFDLEVTDFQWSPQTQQGCIDVHVHTEPILERTGQQRRGERVDVLQGRHRVVELCLGRETGVETAFQRLLLLDRRVPVPAWQARSGCSYGGLPFWRGLDQPVGSHLLEQVAMNAGFFRGNGEHVVSPGKWRDRTPFRKHGFAVDSYGSGTGLLPTASIDGRRPAHESPD
jgi:hypothetical protein